jgi:hypothetical protein
MLTTYYLRFLKSILKVVNHVVVIGDRSLVARRPAGC